MPGKGSKKFKKALHTASGGSQSKYDQARAVQRSMERHGKSKQSAAKAAMAAAKGHLADGLSLEAALEAALDELELPDGREEKEKPWMDTPYPSSYVPHGGQRHREIEAPYPTDRDPRYDDELEEEKWIQKAVKRPGRAHELTGTPKGKKIPVSKLNKKIASTKRSATSPSSPKGKKYSKGERSKLSALTLAKRFKKGI